jgi:hypothetical protein
MRAIIAADFFGEEIDLVFHLTVGLYFPLNQL